MIEAAKKAFGDMDFETELDEETKQLYEDAIAAEFDRSVKDLVAVGDELKGESKESMETLRKAAQANLAEAEASAAADSIRGLGQAAAERGEKLAELGDKSQALADDAEDFLSLAKQLNRQQEKPFFGLF